MWRRPLLIVLGCLTGALCLLLVLVFGHAKAEQRSRLISAVNDLKDVYLHWVQGGRPLGQGLAARYSDYRALYRSRPVWPSVFTDTLSVDGRSEACVFSWSDQQRVPASRLVVTAGGKCYLLSDAGDATLLSEFELQHTGLLDRSSGQYTITSQQDSGGNAAPPGR